MHWSLKWTPHSKICHPHVAGNRWEPFDIILWKCSINCFTSDTPFTDREIDSSDETVRVSKEGQERGGGGWGGEERPTTRHGVSKWLLKHFTKCNSIIRKSNKTVKSFLFQLMCLIASEEQKIKHTHTKGFYISCYITLHRKGFSSLRKRPVFSILLRARSSQLYQQDTLSL